MSIYRKIILVASMVLLAVLSGCASTPPAQPNEGSGDPEAVSQAQAALADAIREAKKEGRKSVDIYLDETPGVVQAGDLVRARLVVSLEDGSLVYTNDKNVFDAAVAHKLSFFSTPESFRPDDILVMSGQMVPGLESALVGCKIGEKEHVTVMPEKAYGAVDPAKVQRYPRIRSEKRVIEMPTKVFRQRFRKEPRINVVVKLMPYYPHRVTAVEGGFVRMKAMAENGDLIKDPIGQTHIRVTETEVILTLEPNIGAHFQVGDHQGRIASSDGQTFAVDTNHPLAGKILEIDFEIIEIAKRSEMQHWEIPWAPGHDEAYEAAVATGKPQVMVLYASWCPWSRKMFEDVFSDPRVETLCDHFIWSKIDSDKEKDYQAYYHQDGFPNILLLSPEGEIVRRINRYVDPVTLNYALKAVLDTTESGIWPDETSAAGKFYFTNEPKNQN